MGVVIYKAGDGVGGWMGGGGEIWLCHNTPESHVINPKPSSDPPPPSPSHRESLVEFVLFD